MLVDEKRPEVGVSRGYLITGHMPRIISMIDEGFHGPTDTYPIMDSCSPCALLNSALRGSKSFTLK